MYSARQQVAECWKGRPLEDWTILPYWPFSLGYCTIVLDIAKKCQDYALNRWFHHEQPQPSRKALNSALMVLSTERNVSRAGFYYFVSRCLLGHENIHDPYIISRKRLGSENWSHFIEIRFRRSAHSLREWGLLWNQWHGRSVISIPGKYQYIPHVACSGWVVHPTQIIKSVKDSLGWLDHDCHHHLWLGRWSICLCPAGSDEEWTVSGLKQAKISNSTETQGCPMTCYMHISCTRSKWTIGLYCWLYRQTIRINAINKQHRKSEIIGRNRTRWLLDSRQKEDLATHPYISPYYFKFFWLGLWSFSRNARNLWGGLLSCRGVGRSRYTCKQVIVI